MADEDEAPVSGESDEESPPRGFVCQDAGIARKIADALRGAEIPSAVHEREDGRGLLLVPAAWASSASQVVAKLPGLVVEPGEEPYLRRHDPTKDTVIFSDPVLEESAARIVARGAPALEDLVRCVERGAPAVVERAILLLGRVGAEARSSVDRLSLVAIRAGNAPLLGALLRNGNAAAGRGGERLPEGLRDLLALARHDDPAVRQLAIRMLGELRCIEGVPTVADAHLDASPEVAIEADDAFLEWGAPDLGFDPEIGDPQKRDVVAKRRAFRPKS